MWTVENNNNNNKYSKGKKGSKKEWIRGQSLSHTKAFFYDLFKTPNNTQRFRAPAVSPFLEAAK